MLSSLVNIALTSVITGIIGSLFLFVQSRMNKNRDAEAWRTYAESIREEAMSQSQDQINYLRSLLEDKDDDE